MNACYSPILSIIIMLGSDLLLGGFLFKTIRIAKARFVVMLEKPFSPISIFAIAFKQIDISVPFKS